MNTIAEGTQTRSTTTAAAGSSRLRRGAAALALGVIGGGISIGAFGAVTGVGMPAATAQQQETPAQRCARQTAEYNQTQAALWKAAHPGQQLTGQPWPAFVCVDVPTPNVPAPAPGGNSGTDQGPSRTHTWDGFDDSQRQFGDDMALGGLGDPNRGLADRMNKTPTDTTGPSAGDSARSNVSLPKPWATSVPATGGGNRSVNVVDTDQGQLIVDDAGRATGEVVHTDPNTGERTVERVADTAGRQVAQSAKKPSTSAKPSASARPSTTTPVAPVQTQTDQDDDAEAQPVASLVPIVPLAAAGAAAGAAGVLGAGRRGRGLLSGDGAPRATVRYPWGDEQTLFLLESAASDHTQRFDLDIPPGGRAVKRADGGVDVLDADGRVVRRVDPPWAFDAAGRPVKTWYEIDPVTGELIQIVEPGPDALYPILADPNNNQCTLEDNGDVAIGKKDGGTDITPGKGRHLTDAENGAPSTAADDGKDVTSYPQRPATGEQQTQTVPVSQTINQDQSKNETFQRPDESQFQVDTQAPDASGAQQIGIQDDTTGATTNVELSQNPETGADQWAGQNSEGQSFEANQDPYDPNTTYVDSQSEDRPGVDSAQVNYNPETELTHVDSQLADGTTVDSQQTSPVQVQTDGTNSAGEAFHSTSTANGEGVATYIPGQQGQPSRVIEADGTEVTVDGDRNDISNGQTADPRTGRFYNTETGHWQPGAAKAEGFDTPMYRTPQGTLVAGKNGRDGVTHWVEINQNGEIAEIRDLGWDTQGNPTINAKDEFKPADQLPFWQDYGHRIMGGLAGDAGAFIQGVTIDGLAEGFATKGYTEALPSVKGLAKVGQSVKLGSASAGIGAVVGTTIDISSGMDPTEATVTNTVGSGVGLAAGIAATAVGGPIAGVIVGAAVSSLATKGMQSLWES